MEYKHLVKDFIERTQKNLELIETLKANDPNMEVYEVTQLINSLLGIIVLPKEAQFTQIPTTPLADLKQQGWAIPPIIANHPKTPNLRELIRYMRHAVAHFNIEFITDGYNLTGVKLWNVDPRTRPGIKDWEVCLSLVELRDLTKRLSAILKQTS
ncbi:MAG: hypothetical protein HY259_09520 [Chloroflexi bacterium]|nr:hypothetical protein [Chloroflexota bacterium]MBI3733676.1 hypothetical protein [Chloroflexota bacterium]